jgi:hypothetical protein
MFLLLRPLTPGPVSGRVPGPFFFLRTPTPGPVSGRVPGPFRRSRSLPGQVRVRCNPLGSTVAASVPAVSPGRRSMWGMGGSMMGWARWAPLGLGSGGAVSESGGREARPVIEGRRGTVGGWRRVDVGSGSASGLVPGPRGSAWVRSRWQELPWQGVVDGASRGRPDLPIEVGEHQVARLALGGVLSNPVSYRSMPVTYPSILRGRPCPVRP